MDVSNSTTLNFSRIAILATFAIGCIAQPASAGIINFDFSNAGLSGAAAFTADALKATEVSHIAFTGPNSFLEHGFAKVTGIVDNNIASTPTGLNTSYSLYFDFTITGTLSPDEFDSLTFTLYGVDGVAQFGLDSNNDAFVNNGANSPIALATNSLISGSVAGIPGVTDLSAELFSLFNPTGAGASSFLSPEMPSVLHGQFFHSMTEPGGISFAQDGSVLIQGGDDTLTFITPEPSSAFLLFGALPGLLLFRRKR